MRAEPDHLPRATDHSSISAQTGHAAEKLAATSAIWIEARLATCPQTMLPMVMPPKNTIWLIARPRDITQSAMLKRAVMLNVVRFASQAQPPATMNAATTRKSSTSATKSAHAGRIVRSSSTSGRLSSQWVSR